MKEQILYHQPLPSHQVGRGQPKQSFNRPEKQLPLTAPISPDSTVDSALTFEATGSLLLGGRYSLEERLGSGGMGAVYKAKHIHLKSSHAIKLFSADLIGSDPELITRFRQEAIASAAIRHPNGVAVTDFGLASGNLPFLVMDYVKGRTLESMLSVEGHMSPERALEILSGIAAGVNAAHHKGIIHLAAIEPVTGKRSAQVYGQRTKKEYAQFMKELAAQYPEAVKIRLVQDNLNTFVQDKK